MFVDEPLYCFTLEVLKNYKYDLIEECYCGYDNQGNIFWEGSNLSEIKNKGLIVKECPSKYAYFEHPTLNGIPLGQVQGNFDSTWFAHSIVHVENKYMGEVAGFIDEFYAVRFLHQIAITQAKYPEKQENDFSMLPHLPWEFQDFQGEFDRKWSKQFTARDQKKHSFAIQDLKNHQFTLSENLNFESYKGIYFENLFIGYIKEAPNNVWLANSICLKEENRIEVAGFKNELYAIRYLHHMAMAIYPEVIEDFPYPLLFPWERSSSLVGESDVVAGEGGL
ncbi:hypothetical protein IQ249_04945 [Lusitaniella coriacea LEGE 07157]|uniref:Uncharacterized protein n=1 Tax=Lusitaniella coriacea LEGE 07157 TaxID=945747 RepID=A0A8J7B8V5_9CYAN|nr:hypothetical protein [Lusitaniella coriacea]MBE9115243.1 hypothetical protein [Lusitaniella coriacea LEGE 07157]